MGCFWKLEHFFNKKKCVKKKKKTITLQLTAVAGIYVIFEISVLALKKIKMSVPDPISVCTGFQTVLL